MDIQSLNKILEFGIPRSKFLDKIYSVRDPNIDMDFFCCYSYIISDEKKKDKKYNKFEQIYKLLTNSIDQSISEIPGKHFIFPIFSFKNTVYFLFKNEYNHINIGDFQYSKYKEKIYRDEKNNNKFYNMNIAAADLENIILNFISLNNELLMHLILWQATEEGKLV